MCETALMTGVILAAMFLIRPAVIRVGQIVVVLAAAVLIFGTMPTRKRLAIAIDYFTTLKWGSSEELRLRQD